MASILAFLAEWYPIVVGVVLPALLALAWVVVRRTKSPKDDEVVRRIEEVVSILPGGKSPVGGQPEALSAPEPGPRPVMAERAESPRHPSGVVRPRG